MYIFFQLGVCDAGWSGFNCSKADSPCSGHKSLQYPAGSFTDGFYMNNYDDYTSCSWYIRPSSAEREQAEEWPKTVSFQANDSVQAASLYVFPTVLIFTELQLEDGFDWVFVYEGNSRDEKDLLHAFTGLYPR